MRQPECYHDATMRILAVDVGTGTQDILLFDSAQPVENALQLIMPSPTQIAAGRIRRATAAGRPVFLSGVVAGGGPCHCGPWDHPPPRPPPRPPRAAAGRFGRPPAAVRPVFLSGVVAGGGPCHWALEDHLRAGLRAYATPQAAATFDDDLDAVQGMGVTLVSEDESRSLDADHVPLRDLDLDAIRAALAAFDVDTRFDRLPLGCLDHPASPPRYSDR